MGRATYLPEVDGLRAVAVLSVLLYHLGIPGVPGGFVGVDVFFVISGFLITRLIVGEIRETGSFEFSRFYARRARRLLPAAFSTFFVSSIFALLLMSPALLESFSGSLIHAIFSLSNFFFWWETDYFDAAATAKPLLHTWSLGVEEQFYLIWPATLVFCATRLRGRAMFIVVLTMAAISLLVSQIWLQKDAAAAFYMLPSRIFEFAIGAALVWIATPKSSIFANFATASGIVAIVASAAFFKPEMPFPGIAALVPCIGAALIIFGGSSRIGAGLLQNRLATSIGRWSYSIYLVHWPIYVFWTLYIFQDPTALQKACLFASSILLGWLQYRFVEERFRHEGEKSLSRPAFGLSCAIAALLAVLPASQIWASGGLPARIPEDRRVASNKQLHDEEVARYCKSFDIRKPANLFTCQNFRKQPNDIIIWGDSHARHLAAGFSRHFPEFNIDIIYKTSCVPQFGFEGYPAAVSAEDKACAAWNARAVGVLRKMPPTTIILTSAKRADPRSTAQATKAILKTLKAAGHNVLMLEDFIRPGRSLVDCMWVPDFLISTTQIEQRCDGDEKTVGKELAYNASLRKLLPEMITSDRVQCPKKQCQFFHEGRLLYRDNHHLSPYGSVVLIGRIKNMIVAKIGHPGLSAAPSDPAAPSQ